MEHEELFSATEQARSSGAVPRPLSELKQEILSDLPRAQGFPDAEAALLAALEQIGPAETAKASTVRKALNPVLKAEFGAKLTASGYGTWVVPVSTSCTTYQLELDFGGMAPGFRHRTLLPLLRHNHWVGTGYEGALGFGSVNWDLIRSDMLDQQLELLIANVRKVLARLSHVNWSRKVGAVPGKR
jgi:hypothetical protein